MSCGDRRCRNGWYYWNGSKYPCSVCSELVKKAKQEVQTDES